MAKSCKWGRLKHPKGRKRCKQPPRGWRKKKWFTSSRSGGSTYTSLGRYGGRRRRRHRR